MTTWSWTRPRPEREDIVHSYEEEASKVNSQYDMGLLTDEERRQMHASFNDRISYLCKMAALVVALVSLATIALGQELPQFVLMGLCLSVALLAIAMLQDHHQRKR